MLDALVAADDLGHLVEVLQEELESGTLDAPMKKIAKSDSCMTTILANKKVQKWNLDGFT